MFTCSCDTNLGNSTKHFDPVKTLSLTFWLGLQHLAFKTLPFTCNMKNVPWVTSNGSLQISPWQRRARTSCISWVFRLFRVEEDWEHQSDRGTSLSSSMQSPHCSHSGRPVYFTSSWIQPVFSSSPSTLTEKSLLSNHNGTPQRERKLKLETCI